MYSVETITMEIGDDFPAQLQGRWVADDEPEYVITFRGTELLIRDDIVEYVKREARYYDNGLCSVYVTRPTDYEEGDELSFDLFEEGELYLSNIHMASRLVRDMQGA